MPFKSLLCSVALLVLGWVLPASAASSGSTKSKGPEPTGNRYLFIVENSLAMEKRDESTRQTIFELINTGLRGRMLPGDTFGVWSFNSQPETRFPMQIWDSSTRLDSATRVNMFLKDLGYRKRGNFERVWRDLQAVVASVNELTVVLITDGNDRISGTPFDKEINNTYRQLGKDLAAKKQPFITSFVLREGQFVAYSVTHPEEPLVLPPPTEKGRVRPATLARSESIDDFDENAKPSPSTNTPPRRVPSIIVTRESVARENDPIGPNRTHPSAPSAPAAAPIPAPTPAPTPTATTAAPQNAPAAVPPVAVPTVNPAPAAPATTTTAVSTSQLTVASAPITAVSQAVSLPLHPTPVVPPVNAASLPAPALPAATAKPAPAPVAPQAPSAASPGVPATTAITQPHTPPANTLAIPSPSNSPRQPDSNASASISNPTVTTVTAPALATTPKPQTPESPSPVTSVAKASSGAAVVVQARQPATEETPTATSRSTATVATAPLKVNEGPGLGSNTKLILASLMMMGAMGCFWVHQQRARKARQSSFISRALPRASAPTSPAKR